MRSYVSAGLRRLVAARAEHLCAYRLIHEDDTLPEVGEVTARVLELNHADRLLDREALHAVGRYPSQAAMARIAAR